MIQEIATSIRTTVFLWLLTALIYPLLIFMIGQGLFPIQANGSLIVNNQGQVIGSSLIGQAFSSEDYFWGRPSAVNYSISEDAAPTGLSGATNLAPSNPDLFALVKERAEILRAADLEPTADLLYSSGSGLDPHISPTSAIAQIDRIAAARNLSPDDLEILIEQNTEGRFLGIFGEPAVNTVTLNLALDQL
ncbi:K(+)-transporting ATPase subunit C [Picosynechococcus sp. PCC 8807]|uniref:K(+)-transporting ATPase subunit C n=1 Tax=Picosynechococcus sp. PCC 8807 TaxID=195248 RepID=UPI000810ADFF|nr:K(+)-transporting ATPase subunit C [Picosynechococcus sp. PCC 8807]ANV92136.1 K+-transporting ATPase subunit C [Picosynechococcus sp. PCC 8807]